MSNERVMRLGLTISAKQSQLTISKDVIRILGSPSYVCVLQGSSRCCSDNHTPLRGEQQATICDRQRCDTE